ncbi:MAG: 3-hydroxybutyryl-CoA dehydrogenase [Dehalococcoidia bacterium]|nr:3-hydroxybutyryl-CoA dehydrogenase [Dehalococcoidia bacterium]MDD5495049.1 3-hydroxybutyryl-CoA dehydrogenase [Dehalococcoidia bacterium]
MAFKKIGVVGCGLMGRGIAEVSAKTGYDVVVSEINSELLNKGMSAVNQSLSKAVEKGKMTEADKDKTLGKIKGTVDMQEFKDCDLVVEAAVENIDLKKKIFIDLDRICRPGAILSTNTSCLSVMDLAAVTKRPDKVLGCHFFNPVPVMKLLELVKTITTSQETLDAAVDWGKSLGKTVIVAPDRPGFIVNRAFMPYMIEAFEMYENGVASREDIDTGVQLGLNHPMGPLTLADMVGLDTLLFVIDAIYAETRNPKFVAPVLLRKMVTAGHLGRKTGKGFYDYK